jgi:hypothetical protein
VVIGAISSAGEHYIDIVGVTGSIPVSPTTSHSFMTYEYFKYFSTLSVDNVAHATWRYSVRPSEV